MSDHNHIYEKMNKLTGCDFTYQSIITEFYVRDFLFQIAQ